MARLIGTRKTILAKLVRAHVNGREISEKIRRMQSLEHKLENMKDLNISYTGVLRRMRKRAKAEINQLKLANLKLLRKLGGLRKTCNTR